MVQLEHKVLAKLLISQEVYLKFKKNPKTFSVHLITFFSS